MHGQAQYLRARSLPSLELTANLEATLERRLQVDRRRIVDSGADPVPGEPLEARVTSVCRKRDHVVMEHMDASVAISR